METYKGHVRAPADAIILFEACRLGLLPRVQRRLSEKERQSIKSGSVFVWDEREAGMRRWTDGKSWSASRVSGSFLTYREMEGKRGGAGTNAYSSNTPAVARANGNHTPDSSRGELEMDIPGDEGPDGYRYKPDGLMKQSFSITTSSGNHLHLISYYSRTHPASQQLPTPSTDRSLSHIRPLKGMYPESTVHEHQNIPAVTRSPMTSTGYNTVPQMAGYARQQTPHWSPQHNNYGWSHHPPMHHRPPPSQQYYGGHPPYNGGYYHGAPPPASNGHSPLQQSHYPPPQAGPPPSGHYDDRRPPPASQAIDPNLVAYDHQRQQPPSSSDDQVPPHAHKSHESGYSQEPRDDHTAPPYDHSHYATHATHPPGPHDSRPSPRQYHSQPPGSHEGAYRHSPPPHHGYYNHPHQQGAPYSYSGYPPPPHHQQHHQSSLPPPQHQAHYPAPSTASNLQIDPRLTDTPPQPPPQTRSSSHSRQPTPTMPKSESDTPANRPETGAETSRKNSGPQAPQASTIPSIGALMNGSSTSDHERHSSSNGSPVVKDDNGRDGANGQQHTNGTSTPVSRPPPPAAAEKGGATRSPNGTGGEPQPSPAPPNDGPRDIPGDKVGFSEDMRVLKVLDKGFR